MKENLVKGCGQFVHNYKIIYVNVNVYFVY